jgi:ATP-dependent Clp protease protease subunit
VGATTVWALRLLSGPALLLFVGVMVVPIAMTVLLSAGAPGKRLGLPHSRVLIHQPSGGAEGQSVDIEIQAREIIRMRRMLDEILATHTGQDVEKIGRDTDRDFIMTASQAKEYGIIDEIIESRQAAEELLAVASSQ